VTVELHTARWAARRRPFDRAETALVEATLRGDDPELRRQVEQLRYALGFAKLTTVRNPDGAEVDLDGPLALHANAILELLGTTPAGKVDLQALRNATPEIVQRTAQTRRSVLEHLPLDRDALEREVTTRQLVIASGGGGGAGFVYPGAYDMLDRVGLIPSLMVGTSIGALMSMFRCRRRFFDLAALVAAARTLSWSNLFRVLESENRYGLPATLRLYLRTALGSLFERDGSPLRLSDMEIPLLIVSTGITLDALKHDLNFYEHLLDGDVRTSPTMRARSGLKAMSMLREFMGRRDALREIVLGRAAGTLDFDVLDAAGFSAAIPGVIHYDVLRNDPRMTVLLDALYASYGITRLGEGGMVSNVPARIGWESAVAGMIGGHRNAFVLALDCFAPSRTRLAWYPFQQAVRNANVTADQRFADCYVPFPHTLSPLNLVPAVPDAMQAIRWGREAVRDSLPLIQEMMRPVQVLRERDAEAPPS
jgi:predicted acylesterase/phospholipase RssA